MRRAVRLATALIIAATALVAARPVLAADDDIVVKLRAVPGLTIVEERETEAPYRFFVLQYTQYTDQRDPAAGTFSQRLTLMHIDAASPMVLHTSGYNVSPYPSRSEPTRLLEANQISVEERFFDPSRPTPADWSKLDIWQAATDHHRIIEALKPIYTGRWISTGASKGGMASVYHRRFYPGDVDGTIAYVAPNDVDDADDTSYAKFFKRVGTPQCRAALAAIQVEALRRRATLMPKYAAWAVNNERTFTQLGDADHAFEYLVTEAPWAFWQYSPESACSQIPAVTASDSSVLGWFDVVNGFDSYTDQGIADFVPYYFQAGTQLGSPAMDVQHLAAYLRYPGQDDVRNYVPKDIPMAGFDANAMPDVDSWVRNEGRKLLFIYGQNDPWGAEPFHVTPGHDSYSFIAPGANHGASIEKLAPDTQERAVRVLLRWAHIPITSTKRIAKLDDHAEESVRRARL